jgi:hypothetical protein
MSDARKFAILAVLESGAVFAPPRLPGFGFGWLRLPAFFTRRDALGRLRNSGL